MDTNNPQTLYIQEKLAAVRSALVKRPPLCFGSIPLDDQSTDFFYKKEGSSAGYFSLNRPTATELQELSTKCQPATFGLNNRDVYDKSYRKAKKLDTKEFLTKFDPEASGITQLVRRHLLHGPEKIKGIKVEPYKLNIYDQGSFFKSHQDTPCNEKMFATLVVVFPFPHKGGNLLLRHDGKEWCFNSSTILSKCDTPSAAFVAFYSDIEHEVTPVESGYRLTLTYNLYFTDDATSNLVPPAPNSITPSLPDNYLLIATLANLLQEPTCLPQGGYFGFGLRFSYPILSKKGIHLKDIIKHLKGSDSVLKMVCESLSLSTSLQLVLVNKFECIDHDVLVSETVDASECEQENDMPWDYILADHSPIRIYDVDDLDDRPNPEDAEPVVWITPKTEYQTYKGEYVRYGNEAPSVKYMYGDVCLLVKVGPCHQRETL